MIVHIMSSILDLMIKINNTQGHEVAHIHIFLIIFSMFSYAASHMYECLCRTTYIKTVFAGYPMHFLRHVTYC